MKNEINTVLQCNVDDNFGINTGESEVTNLLYKPHQNQTCWGWWHEEYYPRVIRESYPVYISERAKDKGKQAYEIIKMLKDKRIIKLDKVSDFIDAMDALIKIL